MKAIFAVISIGFLALANGACSPPIRCSTEPGGLGVVNCNAFCRSIGANVVDACTTSGFPTHSTCRCFGSPTSNILNNVALLGYATTFPLLCANACVLCDTQAETGTGTVTINETSEPPSVSISCDCRPL